jgi:hypothetical protein
VINPQGKPASETETAEYEYRFAEYEHEYKTKTFENYERQGIPEKGKPITPSA